MTDNELRELMSVDVKKGSEALYKQYSQYIYAIVFRILRDCGSREDVEDCFAETFAEIIRRFDNIHGTTLKSYIGKYIVRYLRDIPLKMEWYNENKQVDIFVELLKLN